ELENVIERPVVIDHGPEIKARPLPFCNMPLTVAPAEPTHTMEEMEKQHILSMLEREQWNIARTSRVLDIDRTTLHKKIKKYGLERP
ncbi:MAG TPA: Fis family transcriptional regulator, partial [Syntrophobacteraceae bacterium]|nr:Fis family transcriptional regulator [Syntrophobacteraceae bacterium]